jgi:hypothetical protein
MRRIFEGMLQATIVHPGQELSGNAAVEQLQVALANLAKVSGKVMINPGSPTGVVDDKTIRAVGNAVSLVKKYAPDKVPDKIWTALENLSILLKVIEFGAEYLGLDEEDVAMIRGAVVDGITWGASYLTIGAKAAAMAIGGSGGATTPSTSSLLTRFKRPMATGMQALAPPPRTGTSKYGPHAVQAQHPKTGKWLVAVPKSKAATLTGLGQAATDEKYIVVKEGAKEVAVVVITYDQLKKMIPPPFYASVWFWGGLAVLGGAGYVGYRVVRKRRA